MSPSATYAVKEICSLLGISRSTLSRLRDGGKFPQPLFLSPLRWSRHQIDGLLLPGSQGSSPTDSKQHTTAHSQDSRPAAGA